MNASIARAVPVARRLISSKAARWTNVASQSFGGIIARSTTVPTHTASNFNYQGRSSFSTSLVECLTTEITAEIADDEIDHEFLDTKKQTEKLFTIIDDKGVGAVTLKREFKNESIQIVFDCQDEAEMDMQDMGDQDEAAPSEDDNEEGADMEYGINFDVVITKPTGEKMCVTCVASRKLIVRSVRHLMPGKEIDDSEGYAGPVFEQLNEELQDAFYTYLEERAIDDDLCFFILSYSRVKEQVEYSNWLNKVLAFVEK